MKGGAADSRSLDLEHLGLANKTGRGVSVAVVDSGASSGHPHLGAIAGGVAIGLDEDGGDFVDRLGHGTAVAAAIHEKHPMRHSMQFVSLNGLSPLLRCSSYGRSIGHRSRGFDSST